MIVLASRIEEAKIKIVAEESFCHFQPYVQNDKTEMVVYNEISNEDDSDFFNEVYECSQRYYVNCAHGDYVDILFVEDINDYGPKVYTEERKFWILKDEKMLSRIWVKKNKRKRDPVIVAKMNDKMSKKLEDQEEGINFHSSKSIKSMFDTMEGKVLEKKLYTFKKITCRNYILSTRGD